MFTRQPTAPSTNPVFKKKQTSRGHYIVQATTDQEVVLWASGLVTLL